jgi:large subunit ribosomal protein L25
MWIVGGGGAGRGRLRGQGVGPRRLPARYHHSPVMATAQTTALAVERREPAGSRAARRLRRAGSVPGVVYGGGEDPVAFQVDARLLRNTLAHAGAVLELSIGGDAATPVVVKDISRHPVTGATVHIDMLRVRLDVAISATVALDLVGAEDSPGVKEGGVLEQVTRELTIEALPTDIPDAIHHDVSGLVIGDTVTLESVSPPRGVTLLDDPETVVATLTPPKLQLEEEPGIEEETELVAEGEAAPEAEAPGGEEAAGESEGRAPGE